MTIALDLGTASNIQEVYSAVQATGFALEKVDKYLKRPTPIHTKVPNLRLQIVTPRYFQGAEGMSTGIGLYEGPDFSHEQKLRNIADDKKKYYLSLDAIDVLKQLYAQLPDLLYVESFNQWADSKKRSTCLLPPLSHYFSIVDNRTRAAVISQ